MCNKGKMSCIQDYFSLPFLKLLIDGYFLILKRWLTLSWRTPLSYKDRFVQKILFSFLLVITSLTLDKFIWDENKITQTNTKLKNHIKGFIFFLFFMSVCLQFSYFLFLVFAASKLLSNYFTFSLFLTNLFSADLIERK